MAHAQEKCSSSDEDVISYTAAENDESYTSLDATRHTDMDDDCCIMVNDGTPRHSPIELDDNAVDGLNGLPSLPVCTSTPCTLRSQSCLLDTHLAFLSAEDSGLGHSLPFSASSSRVTSTVGVTCSSSLTSTPSNPVTLPLLSLHKDSLCPRAEDMETTSPPPVSSVSGQTVTPHSHVKGGIFSTPLSLSLPSASSLRGMGVASTPPEGDSPITGHALQLTQDPHALQLELEHDCHALLLRHDSHTLLLTHGSHFTQESHDSHFTNSHNSHFTDSHDSHLTDSHDSHLTDSQASDGACVLSGPLFQQHRTSTASTSARSSSHHLLWDSPSLSPWGEEDSEDEAYFTASLLSQPSPAMMDEDSNLSQGLLQRMKQMLRQFTPPVADRLVGRYIGVEHVDILVELYERDLPASGVIAWLRPYLQMPDFIRMSGVCQQWRRICLEDREVNRYRKLCARIHDSPDEKENRGLHKDCHGDSAQGLTRASVCLGNVQVTVPSPVKHNLSSPDLYEKARKSLRWEELLRHCPLCQGTAKVAEAQDRAQCQNGRCNYDFCTRCLADFHPSLPCPAHPPTLRHVPGTRKSKKQLKRISSLL